jgi:hypothetical protein
MSLAVESVPAEAAHAATAWTAPARRVDGLEALCAIYEPQLALVAAPLAVSGAHRAALAEATRDVPCFEFVRESDPAGSPLEYALPWFEGHPGGAAWLEVARPVVELFADLFEAHRVGVRLCLADRPMCPRFHVDDVVCRLVVTLAGPGSEFLDDRDAHRAALGVHQSAVERPGATIHRLEPLDVGLFKGEAWPGMAGRAVVHRSPPGATRRLVMTVDLL